MYESYFGLTERPFSIAPDPQYLYMSSRHKEAMAHLSYGLSQGGCFIVLTGEVGTGKTTLCRNLLVELPDNVDVALILNANINEQELLQTVCDEFSINYSQEATQKHLLDLINNYLLERFAQNRHTVLIIDEAQLLSRDVLEQIRLLTNLETTKAKLLQIILIGQPELNDLLSRNDLRQLAQRVTARYHLGALRNTEIEDYVNYRLAVAGCKQPLFSKKALVKMHKLTAGIPRKINVLADHALLAAYAKSQAIVDAKTIKMAANDVFFDSLPANDKHSVQSSTLRWAMLAAGVVLLNLAIWWFFLQSPGQVNSSSSLAKSTQSDADQSASLAPQDQARATITEPAAADPPAAEAGAAAEDSIAINQPEQSIETAATSGENAQPDSRLPGTVVIADEFLDAAVETALVADPVADSVVAPEAVSELQFDRDEKPITDSSLAAVGNAADQNAATLNLARQTELGQLLETSADQTGRIDAFRRLAGIWQESLPERLMQPVCQELSQRGLRCLGFSDWAQLERYNRPAIIVVDHQNQLHRIIVQSLNGDNAEVTVGDTTMLVKTAELQSRWNGSGVLFWRPGEAGTNLRQIGQNSSSIAAVRIYLNQALNQAEMPLLKSVDSTDFDLDMSQKVFALQTRFGLLDDSKIGPETYLLMNELVAAGSTPVLRKRLL